MDLLRGARGFFCGSTLHLADDANECDWKRVSYNNGGVASASAFSRQFCEVIVNYFVSF